MLFFAEKNQNLCRNIRFKLTDILSGNFNVFNTRWAREHIAQCPRCQKRLRGFSKVATGLSLLKSQPHNISLLSRANQQAIGALRRDTRELPKALALKNAQPGPSGAPGGVVGAASPDARVCLFCQLCFILRLAR